MYVRVEYSLSLAYPSLPVAEPERILPVPHLLPATGRPAPLSALLQALLFEVLQGRPHERCVRFGCAAYEGLVQESIRLSWAEALNLSGFPPTKGNGRPASSCRKASGCSIRPATLAYLLVCLLLTRLSLQCSRTTALSSHPPLSALAYERAAQLPILQVREGRSGEGGEQSIDLYGGLCWVLGNERVCTRRCKEGALLAARQRLECVRLSVGGGAKGNVCHAACTGKSILLTDSHLSKVLVLMVPHT